MTSALIGITIAYITGVFLALGFVLSAPPINRSQKIEPWAIVLTILGSWFSVGICIGVIIEYLQEISDDMNSSTHRR